MSASNVVLDANLVLKPNHCGVRCRVIFQVLRDIAFTHNTYQINSTPVEHIGPMGFGCFFQNYLHKNFVGGGYEWVMVRNLNFFR